MIARVGVYDNRGVGFRGYLPTIGLRFSEEIGGDGDIQYEALMSDVDALAAWDCTLKLELSADNGTTYYPGPAFAMRHQYTHHAGFRRFEFQGRGLGAQWCEESAVFPEYVVGTIPRGAGRDRGIGWMSTAYDPALDTREPWDRCYKTGRTSKPPFWPSGSGAEWISATGATDETEAKYFRTWLTITGSKKLVEFYLSSDESATLWVAGERAIETSHVETGKNEYTKQKMALYPGRYSIAVFTQTVFNKGGDGIDPILVAACTVNSEGDPATWILKSDDATWKACRRDNEPPNDIPPGPTPGSVVRYLIGEAAERRVCGWENVTFDFTATTDSYGQPWATGDVAERLFTYGSDSYHDVFQAFAEADEFDAWLTSDLVMHCAKRQGQQRNLVLTNEHLHEFHTSGTPAVGTHAIALAHDGWTQRSLPGRVRREFMLELGEALTRPMAAKIADAALRDSWRWDGSGSLNPPQPGWLPYQDLKLGDSLKVDYQAVEHDVSITSFSAEAGEGGLLWDIEVSEWPIYSINPQSEPSRGQGRGLFEETG